jgi:hypothetical protein
VQPRRSGAYTKAPLHVVECGASSVDPSNSDGSCNALSFSAVVVVGHECGRDAGEPLRWTECWLGLAVGAKNPKPTRHRPNHHDTKSADGGASGLAGQTSNLARCAISSTGVWWQQGDAGFSVLSDGVVMISELKGLLAGRPRSLHN